MKQFYNGKKKAGIILVAAVLLIFLLLHFFKPGSEESSVLTAKAEKGPFKITLKETGELKAHKSITVSAPRMRSRIQIVKLAPEGSEVKQGDFLIQLEDTELKNQVAEKKTSCNKAKADLDKALAEKEFQKLQINLNVLRAEEKLRKSNVDLEKAKYESSSELEAAKVASVTAEKELEIEKLKVESEKTKYASDILKLQLDLEQAKMDLGLAESELGLTKITAPLQGLVIYAEIWKGGSTGKIQEGDTPWPGQALVELPDLSKMLVDTQVNEVDIGKIQLGQDVVIRLDAYPDPPFHGKITKIGSLAVTSTESDSKIFDVEVEVGEKDPKLRPGMTVSSEIIVDELKDAVSVPIISVFEKETGPVVFVKNGGGFDQVSVKTGKRSSDRIVIIEGVEQGAEVALRDPTEKIEEFTPAQKSEQGKSVGSKKQSTSVFMIR